MALLVTGSSAFSITQPQELKMGNRNRKTKSIYQGSFFICSGLSGIDIFQCIIEYHLGIPKQAKKLESVLCPHYNKRGPKIWIIFVSRVMPIIQSAVALVTNSCNPDLVATVRYYTWVAGAVQEVISNCLAKAYRTWTVSWRSGHMK